MAIAAGPMAVDPRGFAAGLFGDGRPLLAVSGLSLLIAGGVALFVAATGHFLPHDEQFLGMTAAELCTRHSCRIVHFMIHDRASFGGAIAAIGLMYLWLAEFPLKAREAWAWWLFAASGLVGFGSFFAYLSYGYLDTWHGVATLGLLPCFLGGLALTRRNLLPPAGPGSLLGPAPSIPWTTRAGVGRACLIGTALGLAGGGLTILVVGMTVVFVPQDLGFLALRARALDAINPRLVPLIAHDRAGFGGAVACFALLLGLAAWRARPSPSLWQALALAGLLGGGTAIGVHPIIGYIDLVHLAPALLGAILFATGLVLYRPACFAPTRVDSP